MEQVNAIKITIFDNNPQQSANYWYFKDTTEKDFGSRYKLNISFIQTTGIINLTGKLQWPPRNLSRRISVIKHSTLYAKWIDEAKGIQSQIRSGEIKSSIPPLITILAESIKVGGKGGRAIFKWKIPEKPSMVIAVKINNDDKGCWMIKWLTEDDTKTFFIENDGKTIAKDMTGKKPDAKSIMISAQFNEQLLLDEKTFKPEYIEHQLKNKKEDAGYIEYEMRMLPLFKLLNASSVANPLIMQEINNIGSKYPSEYITKFMEMHGNS